MTIGEFIATEAVTAQYACTECRPRGIARPSKCNVNVKAVKGGHILNARIVHSFEPDNFFAAIINFADARAVDDLV